MISCGMILPAMLDNLRSFGTMVNQAIVFHLSVVDKFAY